MKKAVLVFLLGAISLFFISISSARPAEANRKYASIVMEANTGRILYSRNADKKLHPASLTKMMTLLMVFEYLESGKISKNERIYISRRTASMVPSKIGLPRGSTMRVEDAVYALVTKSANDVAVALAEHMAGTEWGFSRKMTQKARQIGMKNTTFQNASGLYHRYQKSTARDMAILSRYLILNYPRYYRYFSTSSFRYRGKTYNNHNRLMRYYKGMDGLKTGYIAAAGFNLAASARRGDTRLIGVVFGGRSTRSRDRHMARILDSSFVRARQILVASSKAPVPPEKPVENETPLVASIAPRSMNHQITKPPPIPFEKESGFRLARHDTPALKLKVSEMHDGISNDSDYDQNQDIPNEHFEMLARVLNSDGFNHVVGQGDYDPNVLNRIETGLIAISMHSNYKGYSLPDMQTSNNDDFINVGKRVFRKFFQAQKPIRGDSVSGFPFPPAMPESRQWDSIKSNSWSVQVGAFTDKEKTDQVLKAAMDNLKITSVDAQPLIVPKRSRDRIIYRARLTRLDKKAALDICAEIKDCMPIAP